jgi:hypothetical protein
MKSNSDKSCGENENTIFYSKLFPKIVPFTRECGKMWWSQRGHR